MLNSLKLKAKIVERGYNLTQISEALNMTPKTMREKMSNDSFKLSEIDLLIEILRLDDPVPIFFEQLVTLKDDK